LPIIFEIHARLRRLLGTGRKYLCGDDITIADYLGAGMVSLTEIIGCNLGSFPNLTRWYATLRARPNWAKANEVFYRMPSSLKDKEFETV
jgi:glutathione S-transferase